MRPTEPEPGASDFNRRDFIRNTSFGTLMMLLGGVPIEAAETPAAAEAAGDQTNYKTDLAPVSFGIIGCGTWGREITQTLVTKLVGEKSKAAFAPVVALCDTYEPMMKRIQRDTTPNAQMFTDYRQLLALKEVEAVVVATPSHQHREIVEAALKAGKHVYCEAPLATTIEDTVAIAKAAKAAIKLNFQAGLQLRSDPQNWKNIRPFMVSGAIGDTIMARAQWHKKQSWRRSAADPEREKALNWRLNRAISPGLMGEVGIHQLDLITSYIRKRPTAVTGWGGILNWKDDRDVADTIQSVVEYPNGVNFTYDATLNNSFDGDYNMLYGTFAAIMMRGSKAWMFKEVDSPLLGWEVYARKDLFYDETGIALALDATKQAALLKKGNEAPPVAEITPLQYALEAFVKNSGIWRAGLVNLANTAGPEALADADSVKEYLDSQAKFRTTAAGVAEGFEATVTAIKANEAINKGQGHRIVLQDEWYKY